MAKSASATDIFSYGEAEPLVHGGDLSTARRLFPKAPEPFIDLSTGINPHPYPLPRLATGTFARLPDSAALMALAAAAAKAYGAPSAAHIIAAPGTQILLPLAATLAPPGRAAIVTPTYGEFARAATLAGHAVTDVGEIGAVADVDLAIIAQPNNPDGRRVAKADVMALAARLRRRGGLLIADEAFMDAEPSGASVVPEVSCGNLVVLRSFGKFFGLAGLRLGFAVTAPALAERLAAALGPWAVSGPALAVGTKALSDKAWAKKTRSRLTRAAARLDTILADVGLDPVGGTPLFRLVGTPAADRLFQHLGRSGIFVRAFADQPMWLRFGLPGNEPAWRRLRDALMAYRNRGSPRGRS